MEPPASGTGPGRGGSGAVSWSAFVGTYLPALILALGAGVALPAVPALASSFDVGFGVASGVVTAFLLGNLIGTLPGGWLVDRYGLRVVLVGGPLLTCVSALLVAVAHAFPELLVYRFLSGLGTQMWLVARLAAISQNAAADQRGRQVTWMFGMDNTGKVAGPLLGGYVAAGWGPRTPFVVYGVLALVALAPVLFRTPPPPARKEVAASPPSLREMVAPRLAYFAVAFFAGLTRGPVHADLLHLYAAYAYRLGPRAIGLLATVAAVVTLPIGFVAGWVMDRYGRKRAMVPGFLGVMLAMAGLAVAAYLLLPFGWYVALFLAGVVATALTGGSVQTIGADVAPDGARGRFLGVWRFTGQVGVSSSPVFFAGLAATLGYGWSFLYVALSAGAVSLLLLRYVPETRS